jgi:uncharacterized membrane protein
VSRSIRSAHDPEPGSRADSGRAATTVVVTIAVVAPLVALLSVSSYNRKTPEFLGFPFFYWYQFLWVFITAALTFLAYTFINRDDIDRRDARQAERDRGERP